MRSSQIPYWLLRIILRDCLIINKLVLSEDAEYVQHPTVSHSEGNKDNVCQHHVKQQSSRMRAGYTKKDRAR